MLKMKTNKTRVGTFEIQSGRIMVSDPCYAGGGTGFFAVKGTWVGEIEESNEGQFGTRVSRLTAYLKGSKAKFTPSDRHGCVCVDSGQMSISDSIEYGRLTDELYEDVCDVTRPAGIVEGFAVVSSTGYGDGGYDLFVNVDKSGRAVAVSVVFIDDAEDLDD